MDEQTANLAWWSVLQFAGAMKAAHEWAVEENEMMAMLDIHNCQTCYDPECTECGVILCPWNDGLHFHHDDCPSCEYNDDIVWDADLGGEG